MQKVQEPYWSSPISTDKQGFTQSFDINNFNPEDVKVFYQQYGLVIFDNVLNQEQIDMSIDDIWLEVQSGSKYEKIDRKDQQSWNNFEDQPMLHQYGFVAKKPFSKGKQLWNNRCNPNIYKAFKSVYELSSGEKVTEPILAMFDRGSLLRPSKLHPQWKTQPIPHFDINPWWWTKVKEVDQFSWKRMNRYNHKFDYWLGEGCYVPQVRNFTKLQGVLGLSNTNQQTGGFQAVCGFQNHIKRWCENTRYNTPLEYCSDLLNHMQKIYQRAGSIVIFSRELPHGISPNISEKNIRYAQYLRMAPQSTLMLDVQEKKQRQKLVRQMLPKEYLTSQDPIVRQIFMLDEEC